MRRVLQPLHSLELFDGVLLLHVLVVHDEPVGDGQVVLVVAALQRLFHLGRGDPEFLEQDSFL